jgi:hypothetical protein
MNVRISLNVLVNSNPKLQKFRNCATTKKLCPLFSKKKICFFNSLTLFLLFFSKNVTRTKATNLRCVFLKMKHLSRWFIYFLLWSAFCKWNNDVWVSWLYSNNWWSGQNILRFYVERIERGRELTSGENEKMKCER